MPTRNRPPEPFAGDGGEGFGLRVARPAVEEDLGFRRVAGETLPLLGRRQGVVCENGLSLRAKVTHPVLCFDETGHVIPFREWAQPIDPRCSRVVDALGGLAELGGDDREGFRLHALRRYCTRVGFRGYLRGERSG